MSIEKTKQKESALPVSKLREMFLYTPTTGVLVWRGKGGGGNHHYALQPAGCLNHDGYIQTYICGRLFLNHRLAWVLHYGEWPDGNIDHLDRNKTNNRIDNLRIATHSENRRNTGIPATNKSGIKGVCWNAKDGKWRAVANRSEGN